jgi:uncharacterized membrane protein
MFGLPLHPSLVHFPIALAAIGALAEIAYLLIRKPVFRWLGPILLTLALAGSGAAYFSVTAAEDKAEHQGVPEAAIEEHESACLWALGMLGLATLLSWATHPKGKGLWIAAIVAVLAGAAMFRTGHLGGKLVFIHGAGRVAAPAASGAPGAARAGEEGAAPAAGAAERHTEESHESDGD